MPDWQTGLRKIAEGQYYTSDSDPRKEAANWLRAVMGLKSQIEPTGPLPVDALRSADTVDVSAPEPKGTLFPRDLARIYLGSLTEKPTGTYTPEHAPPPKVGAKVQDLWDRVVTKRFPHAANFVTDVDQAAPGELGPDTTGVSRPGGVIRLRDGKWGESTLIHELTHAAQHQQFPTLDANRQHYFGQSVFAPYETRRGERLARAAADSAQAMDADEYDAAMAARVAAKDAKINDKAYWARVDARKQAREAAAQREKK